MTTVLLAKSDGTTLERHTKDVVMSALALCRCLQAAPDATRMAFYHDFGKMAVFFQERMAGLHPENWYRHELLSLLLVLSLEEEQALSWAELAAIATHHKNLRAVEWDGSPGLCAWMEQGAITQLRQVANDQLCRHWKKAEEVFGALPSRLIAARVIEFIRALHDTVQTNPVWTVIGTQLTVHRAALVAADHLASSGIGTTILGENITFDALEKYMRENCKPAHGSEWPGWKQIQEDAAKIDGSAALVAPTGAGKTEAALGWALANRNGYERIFYVLPYQVSINAMAERISRVFPDGDCHTRISENDNVAVLHSNTDLAYLQDALNDDVTMEQAAQIARNGRDAARKIYSPIKVTTVYQLLDIFFGRKFFEVGLLELTNSLVIFDEIHAYDGHTLGLIHVLLEYLRKLDARVFIMTATLPELLKNSLLEAAGITEEIQLASDDPLLSEVRREIILHDCLIEDLASEIRNAIQEGKRTVVVCNTVNKAIRMREELLDLNPLLIHSRFTVGDRARRETKEKIQQYRLVISTQVIEVSLDVSFEVMFTELAPADSLLQRFGRVNRHGTPDPKRLGACHVACGEDAGSNNIYDVDLLKLTRQYAPSKPLAFDVACQWVEQVYPGGLPPKGRAEMESKRELFDGLVSSLRPMLDPPADVDLEKNLFRSVQVVPARYEKEWLFLKESGKHTEAKRLIVYVDERVWCGAKSKAANEGRSAYRTVRLDKREQLVALFEYVEDEQNELSGTGLRLDRPLAGAFDVNERMY
jgi:CRISPR-associated endonuclease/helicase Cas3